MGVMDSARLFNGVDRDDHQMLMQLHNPSERCFSCGEPMTTGVFVYWSGSDEQGTQIWMHQACARHLGSALCMDAARSTPSPAG